MKTDLALANDNPLALNPLILSQLHTYDDFLNIYVQLEQAHTSVAWQKADLFTEFNKREGEKGLETLAKDIKQPYSTLVTYIRTARAFPTETRYTNGSFSLHMQASFADRYNPITGDFEGEERFAWMEKAVHKRMSTRLLRELIKEDKITKEGGVTPRCDKMTCTRTEGEIGLFVIFSASLRVKIELYLHKVCYDEMIGDIFSLPEPVYTKSKW